MDLMFFLPRLVEAAGISLLICGLSLALATVLAFAAGLALFAAPPWLHEDALHREMVEWRRDLHRHPEFGFEEKRRAAFVAEKLRSFGIGVAEGIGGTGVIGTLRRG